MEDHSTVEENCETHLRNVSGFKSHNLCFCTPIKISPRRGYMDDVLLIDTLASYNYLHLEPDKTTADLILSAPCLWNVTTWE